MTDLYENKISVSPDVKSEMQRLRSETCLQLFVLPLYALDQNLQKLSFLTAKSLHKHIEDIKVTI